MTENFEIENKKFKGWVRTLIFIVPFFFTMVFCTTISYYFTEIAFTHFSEAESLTVYKFVDAIFITILVSVFVKFIDKNTFLSLGFSIENRIKDIVIGIFLGFIVMFFSYNLLMYLNEIEPLANTFVAYEIMISILLYILVAYVEEIVFRGYFLNNLMQSFSKSWALVWSSLLFALIHSLNPNMDWFSFFSLFLAGIFLGITYIYTKNLWFPIALHFSWNFFQSLFGFNVSGQDFYSWFNFKLISPNRLNGGAFGLEGSYISTVVEIVVIGLVVLYYEKLKNEKKI